MAQKEKIIWLKYTLKSFYYIGMFLGVFTLTLAIFIGTIFKMAPVLMNYAPNLNNFLTHFALAASVWAIALGKRPEKKIKIKEDSKSA